MGRGLWHGWRAGNAVSSPSIFFSGAASGSAAGAAAANAARAVRAIEMKAFMVKNWFRLLLVLCQSWL
jgi:hypothetical protein